MHADKILSAEFWKDGGSVPFQTSGSTGVAKQVVIGKEGLLVSARAVNDWLGVEASSVWGLALPLHHVGGFGVAARAYAAGCRLAVYGGKWNPVSLVEWIAREKVTHVSLVPTQIHDLLCASIYAPPSLFAVVVGGGRLSVEAGQSIRNKGWNVLASYGMTEAGSQIATQSLSYIGLPYADSPLEILPIWEVQETPEGLLRIKGDALFTGTIEAGVFHPREGEWYTTSDRVRVFGRTIQPTGRADSLVKVMGELVDVEAVERRFMELARGTIREDGFAVVAVPDARMENALVAVFEDASQATESAYDGYQAQAPGPERFTARMTVESFPRTDLGKLRRDELRRICTGLSL